MTRSPAKKTPLSDEPGDGTPIEDRIRSGGSAYDMSPIGPNEPPSSRDSWDDNENPTPAAGAVAAAAAAASSPRTPEALSMEVSASPTLLDKFDAEAGNAEELNTTAQSTDSAIVIDTDEKKAGGAGNRKRKRRFVVLAGLVLFNILLVGAGIGLGLALGRGSSGSSSNLTTTGSMSAGNAAAGDAGAAGTAGGPTPAGSDTVDAGQPPVEENGGGNEGGIPNDEKDATEGEEEKKPSKPTLPPPNVVFIVLDDLGYADVGFTQPEGEGLAEVKMPNTDKLAKEGVIFTNGYSSGEVCAPTRAGFMLGRYQQGVGIYSAKSGGGDGMKILEYNNVTAQYDSINPWIPHFLKQKTSGAEADVNYVTGAFGKVSAEADAFGVCIGLIHQSSTLYIQYP